MITTRSMHPEWLSNSYLVADHAGGAAVIIDAGAPIEPILSAADELGVRVAYVLLTHQHQDHTLNTVALEERYGAPVIYPEDVDAELSFVVGELQISPLMTPGHCDPHVSWLVEQQGETTEVFTGDALFAGTVGGTVNGGADGFSQLRSSLVDTLMTLADEVVVRPGHTEPTTIGDERRSNPFVRALMSDAAPARIRDVEVAGARAVLLLEGPDYDGGTKAWIRFDDGRDVIVGGSMVRSLESAEAPSP